MTWRKLIEVARCRVEFCRLAHMTRYVNKRSGENHAEDVGPPADEQTRAASELRQGIIRRKWMMYIQLRRNIISVPRTHRQRQTLPHILALISLVILVLIDTWFFTR